MEIILHSFVCLLNSRILQFYATNNFIAGDGSP